VTSTFSDAFLRTAEHHAAWGAEQLEALERVLPGGPWTADLDQCVYRSAGRTVRVGLLGTYDMSERSWLWGWANPGLQGSAVVSAGGRIAEFGQRYGVPELRDAGVDLSGFADPHRAAEALAFVGMGVLGAPGYIGQPAGPQTRVYFTPDDPQIPRTALDPIAVSRFLLTGVGLFGYSAHEVVRGYFAHHGVPVEPGPDRISARLPDGSTTEVTFDGLGRIAGITGTAGGR
jgi:YD repeat-containing protein